jgi:hypothetical protein
MTTETVRLDALVSLLLLRGYYPVAPECAGEGAQLINGMWYMPRWGCDTLHNVIEEHGDELANAEKTGDPALLALVRFLAKYQSDLNDLREQCVGTTPEECQDAIIMRWPIIQRTVTQIALKRIGEQDYDTKLVAEAITVLCANSEFSGERSESAGT